MKEIKPEFILTRIYDDGSQDEPEITPLTEAINESKMNRRGFFGTGLAASAALLLLDDTWKTDSKPRPVDKECGKTYAHSDDVTRLAISDNSAILVSGSKDGTVKCWNLSNQALVQTFKSEKSPRLALSPDGKMVAFSISTSGNELKDLPFGKQIKTFEGQCYVFSPDSSRLIVGNKGFLDIYNLSDDSVRSAPVSKAGNSHIEAIAISPDGNLIAAGIKQKGVLLFDNAGKELKTLVNNYSTSALVFSPDGQSLAVVRKQTLNSANVETTVISIRDAEKLYEVDKDLGYPSFSPNGKWLFWSKPEIKALHTSSFALRELPAIKNELSMTLSPDSRYIITGGPDGSIKIWLWPDVIFSQCLMDVNCSGNESKGATFNYTNEWGQILSYTLPCGSPLPAGAVCTCNCVPGRMESVCACDRVCTCNSVCTCNKVCSCLSVGGGYRCTCNKVCVCLAT
jgi:WD40 repeat protein